MIKISQITRVGLVWAVTVVGAAGSGRADTITQVFGADGGTPDTFNFQADQFNTADGTLQSVTIAEAGVVTFAIAIVNTNDVAQTYNAFVSLPVTLTGPAGLDLGGPVSGSISGTLTAFDSATRVASVSTSLSTMLSTSSEFTPYLGTGMIDFSLIAGADTLSGTWPAGVFVNDAGNSISSTITITYTYLAATSVPEPSGVVLLSLGGAAVLVAARKARRPA